MLRMGWTISWEEFKFYVDDFVIVSEEINDGWSWQGDKSPLGGAFIAKKMKLQVSEDVPSLQPDEKEAFEDSSFQTQDTNTLLESNELSRECTWEYHILYSPSYATPVLYFNAFTSDGRLLPLPTLWTRSEGTAHAILQQMRWEALSQQEHPILRRPFFQLHPCKTAEFLSPHQSSSRNPIVTWLSSTGPAVGLYLHNEYGRLVQHNEESQA